MATVKPPNIPGRIGRESICWYCRHAVPGKDAGCSWSRYLIPVPGWETIDRKFRKKSGEICIGHKVQNCPKYERG